MSPEIVNRSNWRCGSYLIISGRGIIIESEINCPIENSRPARTYRILQMMSVGRVDNLSRMSKHVQ